LIAVAQLAELQGQKESRQWVIIKVSCCFIGYNSAAFPLGGASIMILGNHYAFWRVLGPHLFWARNRFFIVS